MKLFSRCLAIGNATLGKVLFALLIALTLLSTAGGAGLYADADPPVIVNSITTEHRPTISATYFDAENGINLASVQLYLDGQLFPSGSYDIGSSGISYTPTTDLADGVHTIILNVSDNAAPPNSASDTWKFRIASAAQLITTAGGTVEVTNPSSPISNTKLTIQPGAVTMPTWFAIENMSSPPTLPSGLTMASGGMAHFVPASNTFYNTVMVKLYYLESIIQDARRRESDIYVMVYDSILQQWTTLSGTDLTINTTDNYVEVHTDTFKNAYCVAVSPLAYLELANVPANAQAGQWIEAVVRYLDQQNNPVTVSDRTVTVNLTGTVGPNGRQTVAVPYNLHFVNIAQTTTAIAFASIGNQTASVTDTVDALLTDTEQVQVTGGDAQWLTKISGDNQQAEPNDELTNPFNSQLTDYYGNPTNGGGTLNVRYQVAQGNGLFVDPPNKAYLDRMLTAARAKPRPQPTPPPDHQANGYDLPFEATGRNFHLRDNPISPDLKITSSAEIHIYVSAVTNTVSLHIEPVARLSEAESRQTSGQTQITVSGLDPFFPGANTVYRQQDGDFQTSYDLDKKKITWKQDLSKGHHIYFTSVRGTRYISESTTLTEDVWDNIVITADNITLDGNNHSITGYQTGYGIYMTGRANVTVKNVRIYDFQTGIYADWNCSRNTFLNNRIYDTTGYYYGTTGIVMWSSLTTTVNNNIMGNLSSGIICHPYAAYNLISNNTITLRQPGYGGAQGIKCSSNTASQILNNTISYGTEAIDLWPSSGMVVSRNVLLNNLIGIQLRDASTNNFVISNTINSSTNSGIYLAGYSGGPQFCANNEITNNDIQYCSTAGIYISDYAKDNYISYNTSNLSQYGIYIWATNPQNYYPNKIFKNNIMANTSYNAYSSVTPLELSFNEWGNYWGHETEPYFTPGTDSNSYNVTDSYAVGTQFIILKDYHVVPVDANGYAETSWPFRMGALANDTNLIQAFVCGANPLEPEPPPVTYTAICRYATLPAPELSEPKMFSGSAITAISGTAPLGYGFIARITSASINGDAPVEPYSGRWTLTLSPPIYQDGRYAISMQTVDLANNMYSELAYDTVVLDNTAPTGSIVVDNDNTYASSTAVSIALSVTDTYSGLVNMRFKNNDDAEWSAWETYASTKAWTLSATQGPKTIYCQVTNGVGMAQDFSDNITLDTTAPTGEILINNGATTTYDIVVDINMNVSDPEYNSGLYQMRFCNEAAGPNWSDWELFSGTKTGWSLAEGEDGTRTVYAQVSNNAGWVSQFSDTITLYRPQPDPFLLLAPVQGARVNCQAGTNWQSAGSPMTYDVYYGTDPNNMSLIADDIVDTFFAITDGSMAIGNTYYWMVVAENEYHITRESTGWNPHTQQYEEGYPENYRHVGHGNAIGAGQCNSATFETSSSVNVASGNLNMDVDITHIVPNTNLPTNVTMYYNSVDDVVGSQYYPGVENWTHSFNHQLFISPDSSTLIHRKGDGQRISYPLTPQDGVIKPFPEFGQYTKLITQTDGSYLLADKAGITWTFNSSLKLTSIKNRLNQEVTLEYNGPQGKLSQVYLAGGGSRYIQFNYDWQYPYRLSSVYSEGTYTYFYYTDGKLTSISQPDSRNWSFGYRTGTNLITSVAKPGVTGYTYYDYEAGPDTYRVLSVTNAEGETTDIDYISPITATVTNAQNEVRTVQFNLADNTLTQAVDAFSNTIQSYFNVSRNLTSRVNAKGGVTEYAYDDNGNVTAITDTLGCVTSYKYDDPYNPNQPTEIVDPRLVYTYFGYDQTGNLTIRVDNYTEISDTSSITTTYTYYVGGAKNGRLYEEARDPAGLNLVTRYDYDSNGYLNQKIVDPGTSPHLNITYNYDYNTLGYMTYAYDPRWPNKTVYTQYTYDYRGNRTDITAPKTESGTVTTHFVYSLMDNLTDRYDDYTGNQVHTQYWYDTVNRLTQTTLYNDIGGNITTTTDYYDDGKVKCQVDPVGAHTAYEYLDNGWLWKVHRQVADSGTITATTTYAYDVNGNRISVSDPMSHITTYGYNLKDKLITTTDAAGNTITYIYDDCGCCAAAEVVYPNGSRTYSYYDALKRVKFVRATGSVAPTEYITTAYTYDKAGRTLTVTGPWYDVGGDGNSSGEYATPSGYSPSRAPLVRHWQYDDASRVTKTWTTVYGSELEYQVTQYTYDEAGNVMSIIDPVGDVTGYLYGYDNRMKQMTVDPGVSPALNEQTYYRYDALGRNIETEAAYGTVLATITYSTYDKAGRMLTQYVGTTTYATNWTYDAAGRVIRVYDPKGFQGSYYTEYQYDKGGRLLKVINAKGGSYDYVRYEYDFDGLRTDVWYCRNSSEINTEYTYTVDHRLLTAKYPTGYAGQTEITYTYVNGNLTQKYESPNYWTTAYTYDNYNRMLTKVMTTTVTYTYDAVGNALSIYGNGTDLVNVYDNLNRLSSSTDQNPNPDRSVSYGYYEDGLRWSMTPTNSAPVAYGYDNAKRLKVVTYNAVTESAYTYNALGQRSRVDLGNGAYSTYQYNHTQRWLTDVQNYTITPTLVSAFNYGYDINGNRISMAIWDWQALTDTLTYEYDRINQLTLEQRRNISSTLVSATYLQYDEVGNRYPQIDRWDGSVTTTTTYNYNNANQMLTETTGMVTMNYYYDGNGNQTQKNDGTNYWYWTYDYENHAVTYDAPGSTNDASYAYDALGRRTGKTVNSVSETYFYDDANIIEDYNVTGTMTACYLTPFLDQNVLISTGGSAYYYFVDGLGSVRNLLDSAQSVVNSYDYTAFGESYGTITEMVSNRYKFTGREWDTESSTYHYRTRSYNPSAGRFMRRDEIGYGGGINLYSYVRNNPTMYIDPSGTKCTCDTTKKTCKTDDPENEYCIQSHACFVLGNARPYQTMAEGMMSRLAKDAIDNCCSTSLFVEPSMEEFLGTLNQCDSLVFFGHGAEIKVGNEKMGIIEVNNSESVLSGQLKQSATKRFDYVVFAACQSKLMADSVSANKVDYYKGNPSLMGKILNYGLFGLNEDNYNCCKAVRFSSGSGSGAGKSSGKSSGPGNGSSSGSQQKHSTGSSSGGCGTPPIIINPRQSMGMYDAY